MRLLLRCSSSGFINDYTLFFPILVVCLISKYTARPYIQNGLYFQIQHGSELILFGIGNGLLITFGTITEYKFYLCLY